MAYVLLHRFLPLRTIALVAAVFCAGQGSAFGLEGLRLVPVFDPADRLAPAAIAVSSPDVGLRETSPTTVGLVCLVVLLVSLGAMWLHFRRRRLADALALERAVTRFEQLAEQSSDAVLRLRGKTRHISSAVVKLLGYTAEEMQSIALGPLVHPEDLGRVVAAFKALKADRRRCDLTCRLIHRNGDTIWVEATFFLVDGDSGGAETICTIRNVTGRRHEADALRLATQIAREAQDAANEANKAKGDFLASMSHEIRTPLNAIIGFADLMLAMPDITTAVRRHAERIRGGGDALLMIVNDILDLSQAEAGTLRLDPRPFALPLLVDECLALVEPSALAKHLALGVDLADRFPTGLMGDDGRLRQILLNLLNNAIKFTPQGRVTLRIGYDRARGPNCVSFEVSDTGIGIAAEDLPHLFQRFRQVDGTIRRTYGGTGLGLAISKTLVERMGGVIGVRSEKGVGSTFWFALDMPSAPLVLERPKASKKPESARVLNLLLVEDVPINQELACAILQAQGHHVDVVSDGADAIMAVEHNDYDLVLMDVQMPEVDGITATRAIRDLGAPCRFVPIVAMTAAVLKEQLNAARAAGMDDVLPKPLSLPVLEALLERAGRDAVRPLPDPAAFDASVTANLVSTIGDGKVVAMRSLLVKSLSARFTSAPSAEAIPVLKAEAHASIAGTAMLGFPRFAALCRTFIESESVDAAAQAYAELRRELYHVVRHAEGPRRAASRAA